MDRKMDCRECQRRIHDFIEQNMEYLTLKRFGHHIKSCPECLEELTIQFLVSEGMARLEEGDAFDLNFELNQRVLEAKRKIKRNDRFVKAGFVMELLIMVSVICFLFWIIQG